MPTLFVNLLHQRKAEINGDPSVRRGGKPGGKSTMSQQNKTQPVALLVAMALILSVVIGIWLPFWVHNRRHDADTRLMHRTYSGPDCIVCDDTGKVDCIGCVNGVADCASCYGGINEMGVCFICQGRGTIVCPLCDGKGWYPCTMCDRGGGP